MRQPLISPGREPLALAPNNTARSPNSAIVLDKTPADSVPANPLAGQVLRGTVNQWLAWLVMEGRAGLLFALTGALVGAVVAFSLPKRFTSNVQFMARGSSSTILPAALQGLAATIGLDRGTDFSPKFYTDLMVSRPILLSALRDSFTVIEDGAPVQRTYLAIEKIRTADSALAEEAALKRLAGRVSARSDVRTNIITVSVTARYPQLSHDILSRLLLALDSMNVSFRREQSRDIRLFFENRVTEMRSQLADAENAHRRFLERNRAIAGSPLLQLEARRLEREVDLKNAVYQTVVQQFEQARIQEARNVPILTVLSPPTLPARKSGPSKRGVVVLGALLGFAAWAVVRSTRQLMRRFILEQPQAAKRLRLVRTSAARGPE